MDPTPDSVKVTGGSSGGSGASPWTGDGVDPRVELRARLAAIVESSDDAIVSKTLEGVVTSWNQGAERLFGWTAAEMVGKPITLIIPPDRLNEEPEILRRLRAGERVDHFETVRRRKDGTPIDVSVTISPVRDETGRIIGASKIARDITLQKRFQQELQAARDAAERERTSAERSRASAEEAQAAAEQAREAAEAASRAKDHFLSVLSHELRTPLNAILGWTQILRARPGGDDDLAEALVVIERNTRAQAQMIEDLLDMSRITTGKMRLDVQQVDLGDVMRAAVASVRHSAEAKEIKLQVVLDPLAGPVRGDPSRLQQCCWNLLTNAIKFTPKGGRVQVSLERVNSHAEIIVSDNGQGIEPGFLPHVFERFRQADASTTRRHGGLGLGLSIVKQLIELHGGSVRAKSPGPGLGATFCVQLPLMVVHPPPDEPDREHPRGRGGGGGGWEPALVADDLSLHGITVLAVDDEADARLMVQRVLEKCGARVIAAASSAEALAVLSRERPDVIVSDIGMPGEDGYEFIRKVRALRPEEGGRTPAAALTAFARAEDRTRALRAGYQTHVAKPVEIVELSAVVASLAMNR